MKDIKLKANIFPPGYVGTFVRNYMSLQGDGTLPSQCLTSLRLHIRGAFKL